MILTMTNHSEAAGRMISEAGLLSGGSRKMIQMSLLIVFVGLVTVNMGCAGIHKQSLHVLLKPKYVTLFLFVMPKR